MNFNESYERCVNFDIINKKNNILFSTIQFVQPIWIIVIFRTNSNEFYAESNDFTFDHKKERAFFVKIFSREKIKCHKDLFTK